MAVPQNAVINRSAPLKTGILLGVSPSSDPTFDVEVARATSSGVYATVATLTPKGGGIPVTFEDILPMDNFARSYKARAVKDGWNPGSYTGVVTAKPVMLPEFLPNITPMTGQQIGVPMFLSTGAPPKFGKAALTQTYDKFFDLYPFGFFSTANAVAYNANSQYLWPATTAARAFYQRLVLPANSTIGTIEVLYRRPSTKGSLRFRIQSLAPSTFGATMIDYTATGAGAGIFTKTFSSAGMGTGNVAYYARIDITSTSGSTASVMFRYADVQYGQANMAANV